MSQSAIQPLDTMQRIELAEGVEVELHPAGPMVRAVAYMIDVLWMILIGIALSLLYQFMVSIVGVRFGSGAMSLIGFAFYWGYQVYFEAGHRAATPGKRSMGLRVVAETGGPASLGSIMLRNLARVADILPYAFLPLGSEGALPLPTYFTGLLVCLFTRRFQRLGDIVARTLVVYANPTAQTLKKTPLPLPGTVPHPPPVTLTREERSAVVRFQERSALWNPARREELAGHAAGLTQTHPAESVSHLSGMAVWLRDS